MKPAGCMSPAAAANRSSKRPRGNRSPKSKLTSGYDFYRSTINESPESDMEQSLQDFRLQDLEDGDESEVDLSLNAASAETLEGISDESFLEELYGVMDSEEEYPEDMSSEADTDPYAMSFEEEEEDEEDMDMEEEEEDEDEEAWFSMDDDELEWEESFAIYNQAMKHRGTECLTYPEIEDNFDEEDVINIRHLMAANRHKRNPHPCTMGSRAGSAAYLNMNRIVVPANEMLRNYFRSTEQMFGRQAKENAYKVKDLTVKEKVEPTKRHVLSEKN